MRRAEQVARRTLADRPDRLAGVLSMVALDETTHRHDAALRRTLIDKKRLTWPGTRRCGRTCNARRKRWPGCHVNRRRLPAASARPRCRPALDGSARTACQLALSQLLIQNGNLAETGQPGAGGLPVSERRGLA